MEKRRTKKAGNKQEHQIASSSELAYALIKCNKIISKGGLIRMSEEFYFENVFGDVPKT